MNGFESGVTVGACWGWHFSYSRKGVVEGSVTCAELDDGAGMAAWEVMDQEGEFGGWEGWVYLVHALSSVRVGKGGTNFGCDESVVVLDKH